MVGRHERAITSAGAADVYEAAVLGVPDEMMGEKVGTVIVPTPGVKFDVEAVFDYLGAHIAEFKIPQDVAVSAAPLRAIPAASCSNGSCETQPTGRW